MDAIQATYKIVVLGEGKLFTLVSIYFSESWKDFNDCAVLPWKIRRPTKVYGECRLPRAIG